MRTINRLGAICDENGVTMGQIPNRTSQDVDSLKRKQLTEITEVLRGTLCNVTDNSLKDDIELLIDLVNISIEVLDERNRPIQVDDHSIGPPILAPRSVSPPQYSSVSEDDETSSEDSYGPAHSVIPQSAGSDMGSSPFYVPFQTCDSTPQFNVFDMDQSSRHVIYRMQGGIVNSGIPSSNIIMPPNPNCPGTSFPSSLEPDSMGVTRETSLENTTAPSLYQAPLAGSGINSFQFGAPQPASPIEVQPTVNNRGPFGGANVQSFDQPQQPDNFDVDQPSSESPTPSSSSEDAE